MCPILSNPEHGFITCSEEPSPTLGFMETATYSCDAGYGLSGEDSMRMCVSPSCSSGEWTADAPRCEGKPYTLS